MMETIIILTTASNGNQAKRHENEKIIIGLIHRLAKIQRKLLFIGNAGQLTGTYTGDSLSIGDFRSVISFCLPAALWQFDNFFDLGYFPYINVLKI